MVSFSSLATLAIASVASAASAPEIHDSPNANYTASFNTTDAAGSFNFTSSGNSVGVSLTISNFPKTGGPFFYYIHESPIPANGTCWDAKGIFNPYDGTYPTGNDSVPASTVAIGNFPNNGYVSSGGELGTGFFGAGSPYWSLNPNDKSFIGNLSVVFQYWNKTPIACANIVKTGSAQISHGGASSGNSTSGNSTSGNSTSGNSSKSGASKMAGAAVALPLAAGVAALLI